MTTQSTNKIVGNIYTCSEYRQEMILTSLKNRLASSSELSPEEKNELTREIERLEEEMGF
ncbi:conserved hypothetical protein [Desulfamplus magnetovallimortis]|uniref:Uncharacterized protein n=1 Tax=Desulfamplus magnetovallimortis TaxID=1246637 RepID=A0A1W1HL99_9BACT|nr:hypothetical protein [Desulfamplus magnetovallimortis]SLM33254.1 conserved hypothetical protein [Desulfamplus magnetovallimortis]